MHAQHGRDHPQQALISFQGMLLQCLNALSSLRARPACPVTQVVGWLPTWPHVYSTCVQHTTGCTPCRACTAAPGLRLTRARVCVCVVCCWPQTDTKKISATSIYFEVGVHAAPLLACTMLDSRGTALVF